MFKLGESMKKLILLFVVLLFSGLVFAQTTQQTQPATPPKPAAAPPADTSEKPLAEVLSWLIGDWEGEGVSPGEREFIGKMSVSVQLDNQALLISRESMNKAGGPSGGTKELMVIGIDGTTKKIVLTLNASNNFIGIYSGELKSPNEIAFNLVTSKPGYMDRRSFKLLGDGGLSFVIERAAPGKELSKMVEINFKKKS